jgi:hypothetical protein
VLSSKHSVLSGAKGPVHSTESGSGHFLPSIVTKIIGKIVYKKKKVGGSRKHDFLL